MKAFILIVLTSLVSPVHAQFSCEETDAFILLKRGDQAILRYNKVPTEEAAEHEPVYTRTGYIHPIYSPCGRIVSGDYVLGHKHRHGLFFAWTKTSFEGRNPEFWNQHLEAGRVSYQRTLAIINQRVTAGFDVEHLWEDLTHEEKPRPVLREKWKVRAIDSPARQFEFTIESTLECATEKPIEVKRYHYGGMAFQGRGNWGMERETTGELLGQMLTSEGFGRKRGNHTRPTWVAMWGPTGDGAAGVVVKPHEENFRSPQWVRLHPLKPYFVFAPMVKEPFKIQPGEPYVSRFRFTVFDGEFERAIVETR